MAVRTWWWSAALLSLLAHFTYPEVISLTPSGACDMFSSSSSSSSSSSNSSGDYTPLDIVLSELTDNDAMFLSCGFYTLHTFTILSNVSNVSIIGDPDYPGKVIVNCTEGVGLFAFNVSNLSISGVTIQQCGLSGSNSDEALHLIEGIIDLLYTPPLDFSTAVLLVHIVGLRMEDVTIQNSTGFGLVGINLVGEVSFNRVLAAGNYPIRCAIDGTSTNWHEGSGGAMFFLYQDYIGTRLDENNHHDFVVSSLRTHFSMTESTISDNFACRLDPFNIQREKLQASIQYPIISTLPIAGAGGLSIVLVQSAFQVTAIFDSCLFHNNSGTYNGEAMQIIVHESVNNSHVAVQRSVFHHNGEHLYNMFGNRGLGPVGSILIRYYMPDNANRDIQYHHREEEEENHQDSHADETAQLASQLPCGVTVSDCLFHNNSAKYGGAICVFAFRPYVRLVQDWLRVVNSTFLFNQADFGSAIYMSAFSYSAFIPGLNVTLHGINATRNMKRDLSIGNSLLTRSAIIDLNYLRVTFSGENFITFNLDTGMSLRGTILEIWGQALWHHNLGTSGGALSLIDESYVVLMDSAVNYTFSENNAVLAGGGIYVDYGKRRGASYDCFFFFERIDFYCNILNSCAGSLLKYSNAQLLFKNNTASWGNAIYGGLNFECPWALSLLDRWNISVSSIESLSNFFHILGIKFYPSLTTERNTVNTLASDILTASSTVFEVLPGEEFKVVLGAFDRLNQVVPLTIFSSVVLEIEDAFVHAKMFTRDPTSSIGATNRYLLTDNQTYTVVPIQVFGLPNMTYKVSIVSNEAPVEHLITVKLMPCPKGYMYDPANQTCRCDISKYFGVECTNFGTIKIGGPWVGLVDDKYAHADCVADYCNTSMREITLDSPDIQCMNNRSGTLCGQCKEGLSRVLGTYNCLDCSSYYLLLIPVFAFLGLALVVIITLFNITITIGYINGLIFYCNIMTIYLSTPSPAFNVEKFRVPITMLNLQLGIESCFYDGMRDIHSAFINFFFPVYLLFILVLITIFVKYMNSKRLVKLVGKINLTHVFATLILLSFTSIMRSCIDALSFKEVAVQDTTVVRWLIDSNQVYFGGLHIALVLLSVILLLVFLLPLLIMLIFPKFFLKYSRLKPLLDAFIAPLKPEHLHWVGVRLFCRILFLLLSLIEDEKYRFPILAILIALITIFEAYIEPFKNPFQNLLDLSIMFNLVLLSILAIANVGNGTYTNLDVTARFFIIIFVIQLCLTFIYHILVAIPPVKLFMEKKAADTKEKASELLEWKKKENTSNHHVRVLSNCGTTRRVFESTHGSLRMYPVVGEEGDFQPAMFIGYRESIFENDSTLPHQDKN